MKNLSELSSERAEKKISVLINRVRDFDDEQSFIGIKDYLNYFIKICGRKYRIPGRDSDEIEQECLFALRFKAIEDFDPRRGKFKSFAILCIKRHLFSLIKGSHQQKRKVLNTSISLNEERSGNDESLSLISIICEDQPEIIDELVKNESSSQRENKLLSKLSKLEKEVYRQYMQQLHYEEIVIELKKMFPKRKNLSKKTVDNALQRLRQKAQIMAKKRDFEW